MPATRVVCRHPGEVHPVEVYSFPPRPGEALHRFATVGVSAQSRQGGAALNVELMLVLAAGLCGASESDAMLFLLDVFAHGKRDDVVLRAGYVIPDAPVMPSAWKPSAVLFDEPLGEPAEIASVHVGPQHVDLLWVAPIYASEVALVRREGVDALHAALRESGDSLAEPHRPSAGFPPARGR